MDFSAYKAQSKLGTPADRTSNVRISNPGAEALAQQQAKAGAIFTNGLDRLRAEVQTGRIMQANNEYNKEMLDLTNELRQNKEQDALNTVEQFDEREQKIRSRIQKKYGSFLYGEAGRRYEDMLMRDYNSRRQSMINYQIGEAEKFNDTTLKNGLNDVLNLATADYTNPENVEGAMNKAAHLVAMRYEHYGEEKIKQMTRVAQGNMAQQVIDRAYANGDMDTAEAYIEKYGSYMDAATLTGYAKNVYQNRMEEMQEVTAKSLFAQFGDNMEAAYNHIFSDSFIGNGNSEASLNWFKDATAKGINMGVNTCTIGVNKALMAAGYKPINTWAPFAWAEEKAAGRTFTNEKQARPGDIVYWWTPGKDKNAEDVGHVGIYAGNGMVYQSGTHGVKPIGLHSNGFQVTGFSRPQGRTASLAEKKKLWAAYQQEAGMRSRFEAQAKQQVTEAAEAEFFQMYKDGNVDPAAYRAKAIELAGNDPKLFRSLVSLGNSFASISGKTSGSGSSRSDGALDPMLEPEIIRLMTEEGYTNEDIINYMNANKDNPNSPLRFNAQGCKKVMQLMQKRMNGEGVFKYDMQGIKEPVMAGYNGPNKEFIWGNVTTGLIYKIDNFRTEKHREPTRQEVVKMGQDYLTEYKFDIPGWFSRSGSVKGYDLVAKGIYDINRNGNGMNDIIVKGKNGWERRRLSDPELRRLVQDDVPVRELTGEGYY